MLLTLWRTCKNIVIWNKWYWTHVHFTPVSFVSYFIIYCCKTISTNHLLSTFKLCDDTMIRQRFDHRFNSFRILSPCQRAFFHLFNEKFDPNRREALSKEIIDATSFQWSHIEHRKNNQYFWKKTVRKLYSINSKCLHIVLEMFETVISLRFYSLPFTSAWNF